MISYKKCFLFLVTLIFVGCDNSKDLEDPQNAQRSTFVISRITGESEVCILDEFEVPKMRLYNFQACLRDNLHNRNINNQIFSIHGENGEITRRMSNESGCIFWSENIEFNFFEDSKYLKLHRGIKSEGIHKGTFTVPLAINPWLHGERIDEVVDLRQGSVIILMDENDTREVLARGKEVSAKPVYISDLNLKLIEAQYNREMTYQVELTTSPSVLLKNTKGQLVEVDIMGGEYELEFYLIHETIRDQNQSRSVLAKSNKFKAQNIRGVLQSQFYFSIAQVPTDGFYRALIKINPINGAEKGLLPGEAVFDLGEAGPITGGKSGKLLTEVVEAKGEYNAINFIDVSEKNSNHFREGFLPAGIYVKENLKLSFKRFDNETTTERDVVFDVTACLGRNDGKSIGLRNIDVLKIRRNKILRNNDETKERLPLVGSEQFESTPRVKTTIPLQTSQCLTWEDSFRHKYFVPERKAIVSFILQNQDIGLNEEVDVMINPWDFGWTFGRDARLQEEEAIAREENEQRPRSTFFLRNYAFIEQNTSYEIDEFLNIHQVAHMRFSLDPKVERPSSQTKGLNQVEKLRKGPYLLRILIRRNDVETKDAAHEYITHAQTIVMATDGNMTADLDLVISEPELLRSRNRILIEFATVNEDKIIPIDDNHFKPVPGETYDSVIDFSSGLNPAIFEGAVILSGSTGSNRVYPYSINNMEGLKETMNRRFNPAFPDNYVEKLIDKVSDEYTTLQSLVDLGIIKTKAEKEKNSRLAAQYAQRNHMETIYLDNEEQAQSFLEQIKNYEQDNSLMGSRYHKKGVLDRFLNNPHDEPEFQKSLCRYIVEKIYESELNGISIGESLGRMKKFSFMDSCRVSVKAAPADRWVQNSNFTFGLKRMGPFVKPAFTFTRVYLPETAKQIDHLGGIPYRYGISTRYSLSRSYGWSTGLSLGGKSPSFIGGIFGVSGSTGASWRWSRGNSTGTGLSLNLDIEENIEEIEMRNTRQCIAMRVAPVLLGKLLGNYLFRDEEELTDFDLFVEGKVRTSGLMVCSGKNPNPIKKVEHYFYMEQSKGNGTTQDPTDIRNRQVKLKLRGKNEFYSFIRNFEGDLKSPHTLMAVSEPELFGNTYNFLKEHTNSIPASYPGVYVDLKETTEIFNSFYSK